MKFRETQWINDMEKLGKKVQEEVAKRDAEWLAAIEEIQDKNQIMHTDVSMYPEKARKQLMYLHCLEELKTIMAEKAR